MGELRQEMSLQDPGGCNLLFRPFTNILIQPEKTEEIYQGETKVGHEQGYYNSLLSRFIIGDDIFKSHDDTKIEQTKERDGLEIQANRKSIDKLKRKIKRTIAEKARMRREAKRMQRRRGQPMQGDRRKKGEKERGRKGGRKGKRGGGGSKSPSPSRSDRKGKKEKVGESDKKVGEKRDKGAKGFPSNKGSRHKETEKAGGKHQGRVNKRIPRPPKRREYEDHRQRDNSSYDERRRGSGSPPPVRNNPDRGRLGRYGRKRKKFRYSKAIMRRIKARYMKEKAKKIFKAKMKRGHVIKYYRKTPKDREKQKRISLEREYGKRGAYEILCHEHRLNRIREAKKELAILEAKGKVGEFHSGDEQDVEDRRTLEELEDAIKKKRLLKVGDKVRKLLTKSAAHLKLTTRKKKRGPKYLQEYPKGFYEEFRDTLTINDTKYLDGFNKVNLLYTPKKEERFVVEEINYEDPWEEPERNRIRKVKQKHVKIRVLKEWYKKKLRAEKRKSRKGPTIDISGAQQLSRSQEEINSRSMIEPEDNVESTLIKGSFQRQVDDAWRKTKMYEDERLASSTSNKSNIDRMKYRDVHEKDGPIKYSQIMPDVQEASEYSEYEEQSRENDGSYEEYSDIRTASGSDSDEKSYDSEDIDESGEDEREYEERQTDYSETDHENGSDEGENYIYDESQASNEQETASEDYASEGESLSRYGESEQDDYTDASYDTE